MASNLGYTLGTFALQNTPTMIGKQKRMGIGAMLGFDGSKDPNKSIIAQQAPSALSNPEANISDIIGGAIAKTPMSLSGAKTADPTVDTSSLGSFGEVNSSAGTDVTGAQSKTTKGNFWDSKGGGILSSLLGVLALGGLGAGIGAISGGGRGALQGASYGMGFGALQDLALRKSAMEGAANEEKLDFERAKAAEAAKPDLQKNVEYMKTLPEYSNMSMQDIAKTAYNLQKPYSEEDRLFKQQQIEFMNQMKADALALKQAELAKKAEDADALLAIPGYQRDPSVRSSVSEVGKMREAAGQLESFNKSIDQLKDYTTKYGTFEAFGKGSDELKKLSTNLTMGLKDLYALGALTGPDLEQMEKLIQDPVSYSALFTKGSTKQAGLDELKKQLTQKVMSRLGAAGYTPEQSIVSGKIKDPLAYEEMKKRGLVK